MFSVSFQLIMAQFSTMPLNYPHTGSYYSPNIVSIVDAEHVWVGTQKQQPSTFNMVKYSVAVKTSDGGNTWQFDSIPVPGSPMIVDVASWDANTCYYLFADLNSGGGSVWKTTDGGSTWTKKTTTQFNGSWADFIHLFSQNNCLALGDPSSGYFNIQISQDGGDTWTRVPQANIPAKLAVESGIGGTTMYLLTSDPEKGELSRAFDALDDVVGSEQFDKKTALKVLKESGFTENTFNQLVSKGHITETE